MATTSYLTRAIFKEHTDSEEATDFSGTYQLLVRAKSMPAPVTAPNAVESTTYEDDSQTFEMGINTSSSKEITGNLDKKYLDAISDLNGKKLDIMQLYGRQGIGEVAKYAYVGQATATPNDMSGTDTIVEMTVTIIPNTTAKKVTDDYIVTDNKDGTFTVTKAGS